MLKKTRKNCTTKPPIVVPVRYLPIPDAAKYLATTVWDIRQLIAARKIPYSKLGKRFVLDVQDLDAFFAANKIGAAA